MAKMQRKNTNIKVSVLLPTLNTDETFLKQSITSILTQTHSNIELIIVADGGKNDESIIRKSFNDKRIHIIKHTKPLGIAKSLNEAASLATGKYLARMDADDISEPDRIRQQVLYMEKRPDISVSSTFYRRMGDKNGFVCESFTSPEDIKARLLFVDPIAHPTVIMRRDLIKRGLLYNESFERAEDYELWRRMVMNGEKIAIAKIFGLKYRVHSFQVSTNKKEEQATQVRRIREIALEELGLKKRQIIYLEMLAGNRLIGDKKSLKDFIKEALAANSSKKLYSQHALKKNLKSAYTSCCLRSHKATIPSFYYMIRHLKKLAFLSKYYFEKTIFPRHIR